MQFDDVLCERCGFVFAGRVPEEKFLHDFYRHAHTTQSNMVEVTPAFAVDKRLSTIRRYVPSNSTIYEIGANDGTFVAALNAAGYAAQGFDPLERSVENVSGGYLSAGGFAGFEDRRDAVVAYYVLEHVTDPVAWLATLAGAARPNGLVVIEVPDYAAFPEHSLNQEHLAHFTPKHLSIAFVRAGLTPIYIGHEGISQFFGVLGVARNVKPLHDDSFLREGSALVERALVCYARAANVAHSEDGRIVALVELLLRSYPPGEKTRYYVWAANEHATRVGRFLAECGYRKAKILDNSDSKCGHMHAGFDVPIEKPGLSSHDEATSLYLLCSPTWNADIAKQIRAAHLKQAVIVDAITWRPGMPLE